MADEKTGIVAACRAALRIPDDCTAFDDEISDLVSAARAALRAGGVAADVSESDDASVRVAVKVYAKANFGMDNPDAERLMRSFGEMLTRMAGAAEHKHARTVQPDGGAS